MNFAVAIDFSRPDTFIDETFVRKYLQDVEIAVKSIGEPFRDFSVFVKTLSFLFSHTFFKRINSFKGKEINMFLGQAHMLLLVLGQKFHHIFVNPKSFVWYVIVFEILKQKKLFFSLF
jgi:hypothetical protein